MSAAATTLTAEQATTDARILVQTLRALHPALDKYNTAAEINAFIRRFEKRAQTSRSSIDMYLAATELAASVRCGHTRTNVLNQRDDVRHELLDPENKLPLRMALVEGSWLVLASASPDVRSGDEIVSIDGNSSAQIVARMLPYLRGDGAGNGNRLQQLSHEGVAYSMMDIVWPLLSPPAQAGYRLGIRRGDQALRTIEVKATSLAKRSASLLAQGTAAPTPAWRFRIDGERATMVLPSFALFGGSFNWQEFFAKNFVELKRLKVTQLIIDIRANEGGNDAIGTALLSYLIRAPMTYVSDQSVTTYERVPPDIAPFLQTWDRSFFDRSGMVDKITTGPQAGRYRFRPKASVVHTIMPQEDRFTGKTWLLVGPENSSATFLLAKLAKQSHAATLVGQPTGGNLRGLNGGQLAWVVLPGSGVSVDIPLLASGYDADTPDAVITPDVLVQRSFTLQAAGRDQEVEAITN